MISVPSPQHYLAILDGLRAIPGVEAVGSIRDLPLQGKGELARPSIAGRPTPRAATPRLSVTTSASTTSRPWASRCVRVASSSLRPRRLPVVVVVNEEFARRTWPGEEAVGKALRFGQRKCR